MALLKIGFSSQLVKEYLDQGDSNYAVHKKMNIPISVVRDIRKGIDRNSFMRPGHKIKSDKNVKLCECCGINPIYEGFRKLCLRCYQNGEPW